MVSPIVTRGLGPNSGQLNLLVTRGYGIIVSAFIDPIVIVDLTGRAMTVVDLVGRE